MKQINERDETSEKDDWFDIFYSSAFILLEKMPRLTQIIYHIPYAKILEIN